MKVNELIKKLQDCDENAEAILSSDPEGNNYMSAYAVSKNLIAIKDGRNYEIVMPELRDEDDIPDDAIPCIVIYP